MASRRTRLGFIYPHGSLVPQTLGLIGRQSGAASILHMEKRRDGHPINLNL
jgi:hypothetical protein